MAPAWFVALGLVIFVHLGRWFSKEKKPLRYALWAQFAIIFVVNLWVLAAGMVLFGNDGKMLTYAALVVCAGLCQAVLLSRFKM